MNGKYTSEAEDNAAEVAEKLFNDLHEAHKVELKNIKGLLSAHDDMKKEFGDDYVEFE